MALTIPLPSWYPTWAAWPFIALLTLYLCLYRLSTRPLDPREPPIIPHPIPFLGPLLGMGVHGGRYLKKLGLRHHRRTPIFTLPTSPSSRMYIVTDPGLATAVQRATKTLSFTPIACEVTERILGLDQPTMAIVRHNLDPKPGDEKGFLAEIQDMEISWLGPGGYLAELSSAAVGELRKEIELFRTSLASRVGKVETVDLLLFVRHLVTISTARYLYGPSNPLVDHPELEEAFWDFDHGLGALLVNILPSITARRAYKGREKLVRALEVYLAEGTHKTGSKIVRKRVRIALEHGWSLQMIAREELSFLFAGIVNAATSTFWILLQIFADTNLLAQVRAELEAVLVSAQDSEEEDGRSPPTDAVSLGGVSDLKDHCPLLVAVYRECLRLNSDNNSIRLVKEPTILSGQYFLAKDSIVQIAGGVIHSDTSIWGDDVDSFDPSRFLDDREGGEKSIYHQHHAAFRAFGGGKTLCPGRHFAMNEILAFVALVVLQLDMEDAGGSGSIEVPRKKDNVMPVHILEPVKPVRVRMKLRKGWETRHVNIESRIGKGV